MRILIDLRCLETASAARGVGRYARELTRALRREGDGSVELLGLSWSGLPGGLDVRGVRYRGPRTGIGYADRFLLPPLLRRERVDLYHAPAYALPSSGVRGVALVLTIHDLVADVHPEALGLRHRMAFRRTFRSTRVAHRVITVSETTRSDLIQRYPIEGERVVAIPNGVAPSLRGADDGLPSGFAPPFLLYVGGLDPLKNVDLLPRVLGRLSDDEPDLRLVVIGEGGRRREAVRRLAEREGVADRIDLPGFVDDPRLAACYREAVAFVFPSRYEGFGLPPLEAMAAGCPVIASPGGALAEVLGEAALLVDPDDERGWAEGVRMLLHDGTRRASLAASGSHRAAGFTWERTARCTLEVYREALAEVGRG